MDDTFETIFEEQLELLPDEVQDFLFSDSFTATIAEIKKSLPSEQERVAIHKEILMFLAGARTMDELGAAIEDLSLPEETHLKIVSLIKEKIVDELLLTIEVVSELENGLPVPPTPKEGEQDAPSPAQVLESLKMRLTQKSSIAPVARQQITPKQVQQSEQEKPAVDLYREIPS